MYEPQEDSYFLKEVAEKFARGKVLDLCTGTGIVGNALLKLNSVEEVVFADIDVESIDFCKRTIKHEKAKFVVTDLFSNISGKFDTITINPPYLPGNYEEDKEIYAGKNGYEFILKFLESSVDFLAEDGRIILLISELSKPKVIKEKINSLLLEIEHEFSKSLFFEMHYVYVIKKKEVRKELEKKINQFKYYTSGWHSYIYSGIFNNIKVAVKIFKEKSNWEKEINYLIRLQKYEFVVKVLDYGENYIIEEFIDGISFDKICKMFDNKEISEDVFRNYLRKLLEIAYLLDCENVKKEEFTRPYKNVFLVDGRFKLIDFERAKEGIGNVNQFVSFLINRYGDLINNKEEIILLLKNYKKNKDLNLIMSFIEKNIN
ncbi:MAG: methyltransferase [Candidatus Woesearchaeota archaeon]